MVLRSQQHDKSVTRTHGTDRRRLELLVDQQRLALLLAVVRAPRPGARLAGLRSRLARLVALPRPALRLVVAAALASLTEGDAPLIPPNARTVAKGLRRREDQSTAWATLQLVALTVAWRSTHDSRPGTQSGGRPTTMVRGMERKPGPRRAAPRRPLRLP